jgi:hypothetical protein
VHADAEPDGQPGARQLLDDLEVGLVRLARAAEPLGVGQAEQPGLAEQGELLAREPALLLGLRHGRAQLLVGQLAGQAEQLAGGVIADVAQRGRHQASTTARSRGPLFRRRTPSLVQTTMSSIRAPCGPG